MRQYDLTVVGGGAAGLAAAITAARPAPGLRIAVLEALPRVGKKILVTGNGRCNLSNRGVTAQDYNHPSFAAPALERHGYADTVAFFRRLGLCVTTDAEGRAYPCSHTANSVLDVLRYAVQDSGVTLLCDTKVETLRRTAQGFVINDSLACRALLLAAGGKAAPVHGSDGSGLRLSEALGHTVTPCFPSLVQLVLSDPITKQLKGIRCAAALQILADGTPQTASRGEILFTDYGLSGIAAMEVSRAVGAYFSTPNAKKDGCILSLDLAPSLSLPELRAFLTDLIRHAPHLPTEQLLAGILPKKVGMRLCHRSLRRKDSDPIASLGAQEIDVLCRTLKDFRLPVAGTKDFSMAQVTAGGVAVAEIDPHTMASRLVPGLYFAGEIVDIDGGCGGYNLQWAWSSGRLAGACAATFCSDEATL